MLLSIRGRFAREEIMKTIANKTDWIVSCGNSAVGKCQTQPWMKPDLVSWFLDFSEFKRWHWNLMATGFAIFLKFSVEKFIFN